MALRQPRNGDFPREPEISAAIPIPTKGIRRLGLEGGTPDPQPVLRFGRWGVKLRNRTHGIDSVRDLNRLGHGNGYGAVGQKGEEVPKAPL